MIMNTEKKLEEIRKYIISHPLEGYFVTKDHQFIGNVYVEPGPGKYKTIDGFYDNILPKLIA